MVVDAHTHLFARRSERFPRDEHEVYFPPEREATAEALLREMERAGVDRAVIVPISHHDEYLREVIDRHPDRFAAIGVAGPDVPSAEEYRRRREESGLQGLRLFSLGADAQPLLAELERVGDKLWFYGGREQMELLARALEELPELTVVLNHLGYWPGRFEPDEHGRPRFLEPYPEEGLELVGSLARFPNLYVLCSGMYAFAQAPCPYLDLRGVTSALLDAYGPRRLLMGSDFPWVAAEPGYAEMLAALDAHLDGLTADERALVRGGNAARLFGWECG